MVFILLSIGISVTMGIAVNTLFFRILNRNFAAFLLSLMGLPFLGGILQGIGNSMISGNSGFEGIGQAIGVGIGIFLGIICYTAATIVTSAHRWRKIKKSSVNKRSDPALLSDTEG